MSIVIICRKTYLSFTKDFVNLYERCFGCEKKYSLCLNSLSKPLAKQMRLIVGAQMMLVKNELN